MAGKEVYSADASAGRTEKFWETSRAVNDFIKSLYLCKEDNNRLVTLICDHVREAERGAFSHGLSCVFSDDCEVLSDSEAEEAIWRNDTECSFMALSDENKDIVQQTIADLLETQRSEEACENE